MEGFLITLSTRLSTNELGDLHLLLLKKFEFPKNTTTPLGSSFDQDLKGF
jgi:hypothetical protein